MQYRLRTLLIVLALGPPALAWFWLYPDRSVPFAIWFAIVFISMVVAYRQEPQLSRRTKSPEP